MNCISGLFFILCDDIIVVDLHCNFCLGLNFFPVNQNHNIKEPRKCYFHFLPVFICRQSLSHLLIILFVTITFLLYFFYFQFCIFRYFSFCAIRYNNFIVIPLRGKSAFLKPFRNNNFFFRLLLTLFESADQNLLDLIAGIIMDMVILCCSLALFKSAD